MKITAKEFQRHQRRFEPASRPQYSVYRHGKPAYRRTPRKRAEPLKDSLGAIGLALLLGVILAASMTS